MRTAFVNALIELARKDKDVFLLTGDLGFSVFEGFRNEFPDRFLNAGVAEQNMMGMAAGLALSGKKVYVYSIIPFLTMRCFEQVRNDLCYQDLPVTLVGVGSGMTYGPSGTTHHSIEDVAIMRALPNMTVICPCDPVEARGAVLASASINHPVYIRLAKNNEPKLHTEPLVFDVGKGILMKKGNDIALIASGNMVETALVVSKELQTRGIGARVISMHTIKPLDEKMVLNAAKETKAIFTIEEHSLIGGLGSAVAEVIAEKNNHVPFTRIALPDGFIHEVGNTEYLREELGLSAGKILKRIESVLSLQGILK